MSDHRRANISNISNVVAEQAVLGAIIRSPQVYWQVADDLRAEYFTLPTHRDVFTAIREISEAGQRVTMVALEARLPSQDADGILASSYLAVLLKTAEDAGNAIDFAGHISEAANRRKLVAIGKALVRAGESGEKASIDVAAEAEVHILEVMHVSAPKRARRLSESVQKVLTQSGQVQRDKTFRAGLNTGIGSLDEILGLMLAGDSGYIMASQGDGKSSMLAQILAHNARNGYPALMFQMEMSDEQIAARELAAAANISVASINEGNYRVDEWDILQDAAETLKQPEMWILDAPELTIRQIKSHALALKRTVGLGIIGIDQLDKVKAEGRHRDRFERLAEVTRDIKTLAKQLDVPVITLAQRTRGAQRRDDPTPTILDADAPSIERDADWAIGLWRKENFLRLNKPRNGAQAEWDKWQAEMYACKELAEVICLKRRRGKAFEERKLKWDGAITRFAELPQ